MTYDLPRASTHHGHYAVPIPEELRLLISQFRVRMKEERVGSELRQYLVEVRDRAGTWGALGLVDARDAAGGEAEEAFLIRLERTLRGWGLRPSIPHEEDGVVLAVTPAPPAPPSWFTEHVVGGDDFSLSTDGILVDPDTNTAVDLMDVAAINWVVWPRRVGGFGADDGAEGRVEGILRVNVGGAISEWPMKEELAKTVVAAWRRLHARRNRSYLG